MNASSVHSKDNTGGNGRSFSVSTLLLGVVFGTLLSQLSTIENSPITSLGGFLNYNSSSSSRNGGGTNSGGGSNWNLPSEATSIAPTTPRKLRGGGVDNDDYFATTRYEENISSSSSSENNGTNETSSPMARTYPSLLERQTPANENDNGGHNDNKDDGVVARNHTQDDSEYYPFEFETYYDEFGRRRLNQKKKKKKKTKKTKAPTLMPSVEPSSSMVVSGEQSSSPIESAGSVVGSEIECGSFVDIPGTYSLVLPAPFEELVSGFDVSAFNTFVSLCNSDPTMSMEQKILDCIDTFAPGAPELLSQLPPLVGPGYFLDTPATSTATFVEGKGKGGTTGKSNKRRRNLTGSDGKGDGKGKGGKGGTGETGGSPIFDGHATTLDLSSPEVAAEVLGAQAMTNMCYQVFAPPCQFLGGTSTVPQGPYLGPDIMAPFLPPNYYYPIAAAAAAASVASAESSGKGGKGDSGDGKGNARRRVKGTRKHEECDGKGSKGSSGSTSKSSSRDGLDGLGSLLSPEFPAFGLPDVNGVPEGFVGILMVDGQPVISNGCEEPELIRLGLPDGIQLVPFQPNILPIPQAALESSTQVTPQELITPFLETTNLTCTDLTFYCGVTDSPSMTPTSSSSPTLTPSVSPSKEPTTSPSERPSTAPSGSPSVLPVPFTLTCGGSLISEGVLMPVGDAILWQTQPGRLEEVNKVILAGFPQGSYVTFDQSGGQVVYSNVPSPEFAITIQGATEEEVRAALNSLQVRAPSHSDVDFSISVTIITDAPIENDSDTCTHPVSVLAIADVPSVSASNVAMDQGTSTTLEIDVDRSPDPSSELLHVVITLPTDAGGPIGTLTAPNVEKVTFTDNGDGTFEIMVDEEDPDLQLQILKSFVDGQVTFTPNDDFAGSLTGELGIKVELISTEAATMPNVDLAPANNVEFGTESNPDPRNAIATTFFDVIVYPSSSSPTMAPSRSPSSVPSNSPSVLPFPLTIVCGSTIVEDVSKAIGTDIVWTLIGDRTEEVNEVTIAGFPIGSAVQYTVSGTPSLIPSVGSTAFTITLLGSESEIRAALDTLSVTAPPNSDLDFSLTVTISVDSSNEITSGSCLHQVIVQAVADAPEITNTVNLELDEDQGVPLNLEISPSSDIDNSELLSLVITIPKIGNTPIGSLVASNTTDITITNPLPGVYVVAAASDNVQTQETFINTWFSNDNVEFRPIENLSGSWNGTEGIKIELISIEGATGGQLAPFDSDPDGTAGDSNTGVESDIEYIDVLIHPVNDLQVALDDFEIVQENNGNSNGEEDLIVFIGQNLDISTNDIQDSSETLSMRLEGFPTNAKSLEFTSSIPVGVTAVTNPSDGTVTLSGSAKDVLEVLDSLQVTLADDDDSNFDVTIDINATDSRGVNFDQDVDRFSMTYRVIVQAVADTPILDVGTSPKDALEEGSDFADYPVMVSLNDNDGSEADMSVVISYATVGDGADPELFFTTSGITFVNGTGSITLTGTITDIEEALKSLQIKPGANNGEDITIQIEATAIESNPTESGANEVAVPTASTTASFVIPVNPVIQEPPEINIESIFFQGDEDTPISLGVIDITGATDSDGSEIASLEIQVSSYPPGTIFFVDGVIATGTILDDWLRLEGSGGKEVSILTPEHYSGTFGANVRGFVVDQTATGQAVASSAPTTIEVIVNPVADGIVEPSESMGIEDRPIPLGADINELTLIDDGTGDGNNDVVETISQIKIVVPPDQSGLTYTVTEGVGQGTAVVEFDSATRTYTIRSSIIPADPSDSAALGALTLEERKQAEIDIRNTLELFSIEIGPEHTADDGFVDVTVTTLDVNNGIGDTAENQFRHNILIKAVADTPGVSVTQTPETVAEDGDNIPLNIIVSPSPDNDGSEFLTVRITVPQDGNGLVGTIVGTTPAGVTMTTKNGGAVYELKANGGTPGEQATQLNSFLSLGGIEFDPRQDWAGNLTGTNGLFIQVISTEKATGTQLAPNSYGGSDGRSKTETVTAYIDIPVLPVADDAIISVTLNPKGNAIGVEDTISPVPISVTLQDTDGSESYQMQIDGTIVPPGTVLYGAGGRIIANETGVYTLDEADIDALAVLPPLHWSSPGQYNILLDSKIIVTDEADGNFDTAEFDLDIPIEIKGVSDKPNVKSVQVVAQEDEFYEVGLAIANLDDVLVDQDGSEKLSITLSGLPVGIFPESDVPAGLSYLGGGEWEITPQAALSLRLPPVPNYSGDQPYINLQLYAVSQEIDGDQSKSELWDFSIQVQPVIAGDGITNWKLKAELTEGEIESGQNVPLSNAGSFNFADGDGSESVESFTFDMNSVIADAEIEQRLKDLTGKAAVTVDDLLTFVDGTYTDNLNGTITVELGAIAGLSMSFQLFLDSNVSFEIPVTAILKDKATINDSVVEVFDSQSGSFLVDLSGTADVPIALAVDSSGTAGVPLRMDFGGMVTDTDEGLNRAISESMQFFVTLEGFTGDVNLYSFVDSDGEVIGVDAGGGSWFFTQEEMAQEIYFITSPLANGTAVFNLTAVALDDDTVAYAYADFEIGIIADPDGGGDFSPPLTPNLDIMLNSGFEDTALILNVDISKNAADTTNTAVSILLTNIPAGVQVIGAVWNPVGGYWIAPKASLDAGLVKIIPPANFAGDLKITAEVLAVNEFFLQATSGAQDVDMYFAPVADGVNFSETFTGGVEDEEIKLGISTTLIDNDGSETIMGDFVYMRLGAGATLKFGPWTFGPFTVDDGTVFGDADWIRIPVSELNNLFIQPLAHWHGPIQVDLAAFTTEALDPFPTILSEKTFTINVTAVADLPTLTVPSSIISFDEDVQTLLAGLSATLVDTVADNGPELLSATITGVPEDSFFNFGTNTGEGRWVIPVDKLPVLEYLPPPYWSGSMTLTLSGIAVESSNGDEAISTADFIVQVAPVASPFLILAKNVVQTAAGVSDLDLSIRMLDTRGDDVGETPEEVIILTFTDVPDGLSFRANLGGRLVDNGGGSWTFTGTEAQSNALSIVTGAGYDPSPPFYDIQVSAVTQDGSDVLAPPQTDDFRVFTEAPATEGLFLAANATFTNVIGGDGNDMLVGFNSGGATTLQGGAGMDIFFPAANKHTMTGGTGADRFVWTDFSVVTIGSPDIITDFNVGEGDQLGVSGLIGGSLSVQLISAEISSNIKLEEIGADTHVKVFNGSTFVTVAVLQNVTGLDPLQMYFNGNLTV